MEKFQKSEFRLLARKGNDGGEDRVWFSSGEESKLGEWTRAVVEINTEEGNCFQVVFKLTNLMNYNCILLKLFRQLT